VALEVLPLRTTNHPTHLPRPGGDTGTGRNRIAKPSCSLSKAHYKTHRAAYNRQLIHVAVRVLTRMSAQQIRPFWMRRRKSETERARRQLFLFVCRMCAVSQCFLSSGNPPLELTADQPACSINLNIRAFATA